MLASPHLSSSRSVAHKAAVLFLHLSVSLARALTSSQDFQPPIVLSFSTVRRHVVLGWPTFLDGCPVLTNRLQWNIIHSNGIPLVKCISLQGLKIFYTASGCEGCILLVHWYDWYQWNIIHSNGIPLVKYISLRNLEYFLQLQAVRGCILLVH